MSGISGSAIFTDRPVEPARRSSLVSRMWKQRADYLYVLPAIVVMLIVIAYPIYYTIEL